MKNGALFGLTRPPHSLIVHPYVLLDASIMDLQTRNRASRMERAFSWIAGAEFTVSSARPTNESNSQKSTKRTSRRSQTFHSFLTLHSRSKSDMPVRNSLTSGQGSVVDTLSVDEETMAPPKSIRLSFAADSSASSWSATRRLNATSPGNKSEQHVADARPPPFFYSYPIPPVPGFNAGSATPEDGDVSASSADSKEIMTWRVTLLLGLSDSVADSCGRRVGLGNVRAQRRRIRLRLQLEEEAALDLSNLYGLQACVVAVHRLST